MNNVSIYYECQQGEKLHPGDNQTVKHQESLTPDPTKHTQRMGVTFQNVSEISRNPSVVKAVCRHARTKKIAGKFVVNGDSTIATLQTLLRSKVTLGKNESLYIFTEGGKLLRSQTLLADIVENSDVVNLVFSEE